MIVYTPTSQLKIEGLHTPFKAQLSSSNRWVELGKLIPWDELPLTWRGSSSSVPGASITREERHGTRFRVLEEGWHARYASNLKRI